MLDLRHIDSFIAVAETRSFSTAAERVGTVQSAISTHIRKLETHLGRRLLSRGRGLSVDLTPEGTAFLVQARRMMSLADEMARPGAPTSAPIRLGTTATFALSVVPRAWALAAQRHDAPAVTVRTARSHQLLDLLDEGQIDMALVLDQGPRPTRVDTRPVELVWAATESFVHNPTSPLPLVFLDDARDLRRHAFTALDRKAAQTAHLSLQPDPLGLRAALLSGLFATVLPKPALACPLSEVGARLGLPPLPTIALSVYSRGKRANASGEAFLESLIAEV